MLIVLLSMGLITPIIGCMKFTNDLAKVGTIIGQVTDILTAPELPRPEKDLQTPRDSTVALRGVRFGYNDTEVLHGMGLQVVSVFKKLITEQGTTVIMTTHDPDLMQVADSVFTLRDGRLLDPAEGGDAP